MSMEGLLKARETLQGSIHVGRSHEKTYRREASSMHGKRALKIWLID